ncbi:MAG TPA: hypothetical protein VH165_34610 [Kofleriaceae bacterium]|nr:hypothetical protein [Kofleriaceae bacterium]
MRIALVLLCTAAGFAAAWLRPTRGLAELRDACVRATDAAACEAAADRLERDAGDRAYREEPGLYLAIACEAGRATACDRAQAWARRYADYEVFELDVGCMVRHRGFACEEVANALRDEQGEDAAGGDPGPALALARSRMTQALDRYLEGCARGQAESCLGASRVFSAAFGVAWDLRAAHAYAARACELGLADACEQEADAAPGPAAIALYRKVIALRPAAPHAWLKLARAEQAAGAPGDEVAASYRRACAALAFDACSYVARAGDLRGEPAAVVEAFARWCEAGDARACALVQARGEHAP